MEKVELNGMVYEFKGDIALMALLDENADRVYETADPPPNTPLTLEELREMDGEPVCIAPVDGGPYTWMLVDTEYEVLRGAHGELAVFENRDKTWLAYRRKPKEGTT